MPLLSLGSKGSKVKELQEFLWSIGAIAEDNPFWKSSVAKKARITSPSSAKAKRFWIDGSFGEWTEEALKYFQVTHIGPNDDYLSPTGILDNFTVWAINHRSTKEQDQGIDNREHALRESIKIPQTGKFREPVLDIAFSFLGAKEIPKGSNGGPQIDIITNNWKVAYCCLFTGYCFHKITGYYPFGPSSIPKEKWKKVASCAQARNYAKALNIWKPAGKVDPEIGDIGNIDYGKGRGHHFFVTGIERDSSGKVISVNTIAANENDMIKEGKRLVSKVAGFIDPYDIDDILLKFLKTGKDLKSVDKDKTR